MFRTAGQTAIGLKFFVDTHWWPAGVICQKQTKFFSPIFLKFFFPRAMPGPSASDN